MSAHALAAARRFQEVDAITFRAFIAADLGTLPAVAAFAQELQEASPGLKVVSPDHLHLTLKFLGDTEEGLVPELMAVIRAACAGVPSVDLQVRGAGAFPSFSRMSVLWLGIEGAEPLARIAGALDRALEPLGYAMERRPWAAHLTLARVKGGHGLERARSLLETQRTASFGNVRVDEVRLKKSVLTPQGPVYSTVEAVRLPG